MIDTDQETDTHQETDTLTRNTQQMAATLQMTTATEAIETNPEADTTTATKETATTTNTKEADGSSVPTEDQEVARMTIDPLHLHTHIEDLYRQAPTDLYMKDPEDSHPEDPTAPDATEANISAKLEKGEEFVKNLLDGLQHRDL